MNEVLKKNQIVTLTITDMAEGGEGIGRFRGYPLFVKGAVTGDTVEAVVTKAGKSYGYGRVLKVIEASSDRIAAPCPVAGPCGGCQLQALSGAGSCSRPASRGRNPPRRLSRPENPADPRG